MMVTTSSANQSKLHTHKSHVQPQQPPPPPEGCWVVMSSATMTCLFPPPCACARVAPNALPLPLLDCASSIPETDTAGWQQTLIEFITELKIPYGQKISSVKNFEIFLHDTLKRLMDASWADDL